MKHFVKCVNSTQSFRSLIEPEIIHVIKTGFEDRYMVVYEDAYEQITGKVLLGSKAEIEELFGIKL